MLAVLLVALVGVVQSDPTGSTVKLNNGVEMPILAFGAQVWPDDTCKTATSAALTAGFRFVWSSMLIGDSCQKAQWDAIQSSSVPLAQIFVAGTINSGSCSDGDSCYTQTKSGAESQMQILAKSPLDMLMLDFPSNAQGCDGVVGQWKALEEIYAAKRVRTIAVSNFSPEQLKCLISANSSATIPSVNQVSYSVGHGSDTVVADDGAFGTFVQAYSPLESGMLASDPLLIKIGATHKKSAVQVAFKWIAQRNVTINTQSTSLAHLQEDLAIFDFTLSDDDMAQLNAHVSKKHIMV